MVRNIITEDKDCWFCYDNQKIEKELIISEQSQNSFYLAMPKGPVTDFHFLIVPKQHIASSLELGPTQLVDYLQQRALVTKHLNEKSMDYITFERNMRFKF